MLIRARPSLLSIGYWTGPRSGPVYLRQPEIASLASEQLHAIDSQSLCSLHAYVAMPNHVHVLWTPQGSLPELVRQVKGPIARSAN
jgi:REP element-mobilizing transposase RayT